MKFAVISDIVYRANLPDDPNCLSAYGSEPYHCLLARELVRRGHEVDWYAPAGSTELTEYNVKFHPLMCIFGSSSSPEGLQYLQDIQEEPTNPYSGLHMPNMIDYSLDTVSFDESKTSDLLKNDLVIDMTTRCMDIEKLKWYHGFNKYVCYRNGYAANYHPRLKTEERHYVVPSRQNQKLFKQMGGFDAEMVYYGIDDGFYKPGSDAEYWSYFDKKGLTQKEYWVFPHRTTSEKGMYVLLKLAKDFPDEIFVICAQSAIPEHKIQLIEFLRTVSKMNLDNVEYVPVPIEPRHHYFKRELIRNAKGCLSPFRAQQYQEGFGLSNAESVAVGTPLLITDSDSTQELWKNEVDGLFCDGDYHSYRLAIKHWSSYDFHPVNKFSLNEFAKGYEELVNKYS